MKISYSSGRNDSRDDESDDGNNDENIMRQYEYVTSCRTKQYGNRINVAVFQIGCVFYIQIGKLAEHSRDQPPYYETDGQKRQVLCKIHLK